MYRSLADTMTRIDLSRLATPLLGIAAWSGAGKTTLLEALLPLLRSRGLEVAVIKHAHHEFDIDVPGKDSHRLRQAGAAPMLVASRYRFALMMETPGRDEPHLDELIEQVLKLSPDLILIEGFKHEAIPKLELYRDAVGKPLRAFDDPWVRAVATTGAVTLPEGVERLDLDDHSMLLDWLMAWPIRWPALRLGPRNE